MKTKLVNTLPKQNFDKSLNIQVITDFESFLSLKKEWDHLYERCPEKYPTISHDWLVEWWLAFSTNESNLYVILIWQQNQLVGAAPLYYKKKKKLGRERNHLMLMTNDWVNRSLLLICEPVQLVVNRILQHLFKESPSWDLMELEPLIEDSRLVQLLFSQLTEFSSRLGIDLDYFCSPYLRTPDSWEELIGSLSPSFRKSLRRKLNTAKKRDDLNYRIIKDQSAIPIVMDISLDTWQHDNGTSMATEEHIKQFYTGIMRSAAASGTLSVAVLELQGQPIAFEFNLICGDTMHNFKLGYRKDYSALSPGVLLKAFVLQSMFGSDEKLKEHDFMGVAEQYKLNWCKKVRQHCQLTVYRKGLDLTLYYYLHYRIKPMIKNIFPWLLPLRNKISSYYSS